MHCCHRCTAAFPTFPEVFAHWLEHHKEDQP